MKLSVSFALLAASVQSAVLAAPTVDSSTSVFTGPFPLSSSLTFVEPTIYTSTFIEPSPTQATATTLTGPLHTTVTFTGSFPHTTITLPQGTATSVGSCRPTATLTVTELVFIGGSGPSLSVIGTVSSATASTVPAATGTIPVAVSTVPAATGTIPAAASAVPVATGTIHAIPSAAST